MITSICITFAELFDNSPTMEDLTDLVKRLPLRHAIYVLSGINLALRYAMQESGRANFGKFQESIIIGHLDDETLDRLKQRFSHDKCEERPAFVPHSVLTVLRIVLTHCDPTPSPQVEEDELVRHTIGRACLMMNNLLFIHVEETALLMSLGDEKRVELMVQMMASVK